MKLVFAHDHVFQKDQKGNLYTGGSFNNQVWKRYLNHFSEITILARQENMTDKYNNKTYNAFDLKETKLKVVPSLSGPIRQFSNKKEAESIIRSSLEKSDALIARLPSETGNLAIKIAKELGVPYAVEVVACVWDALWNYGSLMAKVYAPVAMLKMKRNIKHAPYALYVTNEFLQKRYPSLGEQTNVSNVEIEYVVENPKSSINKNDKIIIGMIGSLKNKIKGWETAFKAISILKDKGINFEFRILGDGDADQWKSKLRELNIEDNVVFSGVLPGGEPVLNWLDEIDIYIQPSYQEGLPRAVIEAMSRGCPVVGSSAGGIPELINKDCIHHPRNNNILAEILERIINEKQFFLNCVTFNVNRSEYFKKQFLDKKRDSFWGDFLNYVIDKF